MTATSVHYIKSQSFVDAPLDGTFIGTSGDNKVVICPFSERMAIPQRMVVEGPDGEFVSPDAIKEIEGKEGIVRTMHGAFYMDLDGAKKMIESLQKAIESTEGTE